MEYPRNTAMTNEEVVRAACQVVWSDGDVSRAGEFYSDDFKADYPMTNWGMGLEGVKNLARRIVESRSRLRE